jgi:molecular chaperone GrpE (heat shock protein)
MLQSSNKFSSTAATLTEFLPILDDLVVLKEKYADDEFGKQYNALPGAMRNAYSQMGVTEFTVKPGDKVDTSRMVIVESVYSEEYAKDTVIRPISMGMELSGNIVRMASCVTSLGPDITLEERESEEEEEEEEVSAPEEGAPPAETDTSMESSDETAEK